MRPIPPGGTDLLDAEEAAALTGLSVERFRFLEERRFITAMDTPVGPRYRQDELEELRDAIAPAPRFLGVGVPTLRLYAADGVLYRDAQGFYDADEVHLLNRKRNGRKSARLPGRERT